MRKLIIILLVLLGTYHETIAQKKEVKFIQESFKNYTAALLDNQGHLAINYLAQNTINYYGTLLQHVKSSDSTQLMNLTVLDRLMVLIIRQRASKSEILGFDAKGLLIYAINKGMVGKNTLNNNELGKITIEGNSAKAAYRVNGIKTPLYLDFYKEENTWRLDLTSVFTFSNMAFNQLVQASGMQVNEYLEVLLEIVSGKKPDASIWQPIQE